MLSRQQEIQPNLWNARTSNEVQHVENLSIVSDISITFKIDLRKLWSQRPVWSFKRAHPGTRSKPAWSRNPHKRSQFKMLFHIRPQHYSGENPIGSDIIHVSGGDAKRDFEDDHLTPPKPPCRPLSRLIHFNPRNLEQLYPPAVSPRILRRVQSQLLEYEFVSRRPFLKRRK